MATIMLRHPETGEIRRLRVPFLKYRVFQDFVNEVWELLKDNPQGLGVEEIARATGHHPSTVHQWMEFMLKNRDFFHIKAWRDRAAWKTYRFGCTPEEEFEIIRGSMAAWLAELFADKIMMFLRKHPYVGNIILMRIYQAYEYGQPILPILSALIEPQNVEENVETAQILQEKPAEMLTSIRYDFTQ
jgi:hypothetical protein